MFNKRCIPVASYGHNQLVATKMTLIDEKVLVIKERVLLHEGNEEQLEKQ